MLSIKYRSVPWVLVEGGSTQRVLPKSNRRASRVAIMQEGGIVKRLMMYVIPLSAIAVLVFAAIAAAQSVPEGQEPSQNTTDVHRIYRSGPLGTCTRGPNVGRFDASADPTADEDDDGVICGRVKPDGTIVYRDDHSFPNGH
jgi:hypothetical protein